MKIFFDTEFTGLHKDTTLISIGLVDENDRTFYAEFMDYDKSQVDDWIENNVISHLTLGNYEHYGFVINNTFACGSKEYVRQKLEKWLEDYDEVQLVSDCCHYDMVLLIDIWGHAFNIPKKINPACHDINQDIAKDFNVSEAAAFDMSREDILNSYNEIVKDKWPDDVIEINGNKHNALYDARVIKEIYKITHFL